VIAHGVRREVRVSGPTEWRESGLVQHFHRIHTTMGNRSFCFVLGAGASVSSGIPSGASLAWRWLEELHHLEGNGPLEAWATEANLEIAGFNLQEVARFYPQIFLRRFGADPEEGYAYLEEEMRRAEPSFGYTVLARILALERHKVVITTNFDNLVADALTIYGDTYPLVCGHESLATFARTHPRRPLVAKIHRDLFLAPVNDPDGVERLADGWHRALSRLFATYTPIFIGYGGNDGSLMGFLEGLSEAHVPGRPIWCYRVSERPPQRVLDLVEKLGGVLVAIHDFDELMMRLNNVLGYTFLNDHLERRATGRRVRYLEEVRRLARRVSGTAAPAERAASDPPVAAPTPATVAALRDTIERAADPFGVLVAADAAPTPQAKEAIFERGVERHPQSALLAANYARFLTRELGRHDRAQELFERAIELEPTLAANLGNYATLLTDIKGEHDRAEELYRRALALDPADGATTTAFADFLRHVRHDLDAAEALYQRAAQLAPESGPVLANLASFLTGERGEHARAAELYERALRHAPDDPEILLNYATLLADDIGDEPAAERLYQRALVLDPANPSLLGSVAELYLRTGRPQLARPLAARMWQVTSPGTSRHAVAGMFRGLVGRMLGEDDAPALGRLKQEIADGVEPSHWNFGPLLAALPGWLSAEDVRRYELLAAVLCGEEEAEALQADPAWKAVEPRSALEPWP
jgi:Tfp pilus assembly protein PilF